MERFVKVRGTDQWVPVREILYFNRSGDYAVFYATNHWPPTTWRTEPGSNLGGMRRSNEYDPPISYASELKWDEFLTYILGADYGRHQTLA
jgi:hypothetical protein